MSLRKPSSPPILYLALINHYESSRHMSAQAVLFSSSPIGPDTQSFMTWSYFSFICLMSPLGGATNIRKYSRLNWEELSYPTLKATSAASADSANKRRRASWSISCFTEEKNGSLI
ncbi:hypothetical protein GMA19_02447 [Paenibacillus polymyxa E681]|nr:hypothetical protein GE561_02447 [Paenibacillus polymyxa E681]QNV62114.1 hypothetical protein GMA19_02447 [Paenibacillus polymyxa E681]